MKITAILAYVLVFSTVSAVTKHHNRVKRIEVGGPIEELINNIIQGAEEPKNIDIITINGFGFSVIIKDYHRDGLHSVIVSLSISSDQTIKIRAGITIKELNIDVTSWESNFPIAFGYGKVDFNIKDVSALLEIELEFDGTAKPTNVEISVGRANFIITGVQNDDALSQIITDKVNYFLNVVGNDPSFHSILEAIIDGLLSKK